MSGGIIKEINKGLKKDALEELSLLLKNIKSNEDALVFLNLFFTESEKNLILRRALIALFLKDGKTYSKIRKTLDVSKNTISNIKDLINGRGYGRNPSRTRVYSRLYKPKKKSNKIFKIKYKGVESII